MGWDINVHRIDFDRLQKVQGCRNERLLQQIVSSYGLDEPNEVVDDSEDDDEGDPPIPVKQALRSILFNDALDDSQALRYGDAMAMIYETLAAEYVGDLRVAAFGISSFFQEVDRVLEERGFPGYMSNLVMAGCPMAIPVETDGALGFLTPSDCQRFAREYTHHNWKAVDPGLKTKVNDLLKWCTSAANYGHGLVSIGG